jgi:hypothetical protein
VKSIYDFVAEQRDSYAMRRIACARLQRKCRPPGRFVRRPQSKFTERLAKRESIEPKRNQETKGWRVHKSCHYDLDDDNVVTNQPAAPADESDRRDLEGRARAYEAHRDSLKILWTVGKSRRNRRNAN